MHLHSVGVRPSLRRGVSSTSLMPEQPSLATHSWSPPPPAPRPPVPRPLPWHNKPAVIAALVATAASSGDPVVVPPLKEGSDVRMLYGSSDPMI